MTAIKKGDRVKIHYTGRLENGSVFESSHGRTPLEFTAGSNEVIQGLSQAVLGMQPGESKTVEIPAEDAFGPHQPGLAQRVPRHMVPEQVNIGDPLQARSGDQTFVVWVKDLGDDFAILDANHPLAGQKLTFDIEMVSVASPSS